MRRFGVWGGYAQETVTDELTATSLKLTSSYSKFSNITLTSDAVYSGAGYVGTGKNNYGIQIKSKRHDNSFYTGIVSSASGGKIKSITIDFNKSSNGIYVYGKNTAYDTADDLFNSSKKGDLIQDVLYSSSEVVLTPKSDYKYVGFCSKSGAVYIDKITIVWEKEGSSSGINTQLTFQNSSYSFATTDDLSSFTGQKATLTAGDETLTGKSIAYSKDDTNNVISTLNEDGTLVLSGNAGTAKVTATFGGDNEYASSTASYTISVKPVVKDIATLKPQITSTSSSSTQSFSLKLTDAIVTYKSGDNAYVQDNTGGLYTTDGSSLNVGDKINGIVDVKAYKKSGQRIVTSWTLSSDASVEQNVEFTPEVVTVAQLNEDIDKYENMQVKVVGATVNAAMSSSQTTVSQNDETITLFSKAYNITWELKADDYVDIIGFPCKYNNTNEICVWRKGDVTINESVVATTLSLAPATTEYTVEKGKESAFTAPTVTVKDANNETVADAKITYKSSNTDVATVDSETGNVTFGSEFGTTTITASYAGDATHKAAKDISYTIIYGKVKTTMAWSAAEVKANIGQDFTAPTLSLTADGESILDGKTITYESSEPTVAEISETGVVTIKGIEGTTTITATFANDDTYADATAQYTLTVVDPNKMEVTFDFTDPSKYEYEKPAPGEGTTLEEGATISSGIVTITNVKSGGTSTSTNPNVFWNKKDEGITLRFYQNAKATISVPDGYLIKSVQFSNSKTASDIVITPEQYDSETSTWTGSANIISLSFNGTAWFSSMTVSYAKATSGTLTFKAQNSDGYYATFSSDKDVVFTEDVVVYGVNVANGKLRLTDFTNASYEVTDATGNVSKGYYVPANTGVLVNSIDETATYYFPKTAATATLPANLLKPAPANGGIFTAEDGYKYYKLAYDDFEAKTGLGFYWGADNAGAFSVKAGTAYLAVPTSDANNAKGFTFDGGTTGINEVTTNDSKVKNIYNLNGQRVENMSHAGLYIVNGKKVVIRK